MYRIVQEGLTNVRKHAPGQSVRVTITRANSEVEIRMRNARSDLSPEVPGSGSGLIGLGERASLAGGTFDHAVTRTGEFELTATLPWR